MTRRTYPWSRTTAGWSATGRSATERSATLAIATALVIAAVGCSSPPGTTVSPSPTVSTTTSAPAATDGLTLPPPPTAAPIQPDLSDQPPAASMVAEGGDPIIGQLGTYTWRESGSDSPWLPGAVIAVGSGEPLTVSLDPAIPVGAWQARYVPASATGPDGALELGQGAGDPDFGPPAPGTWTVTVHVEFADGLGDANYFWKVAVD